VNDDCLKLTTYFGERQRTDGRFLADALLELYGRHEVATSVMLRGIASFGPRHVLRTDESLSLSEDPPVAVVAVDTRAKIEDLIDDVVTKTPRGLVTFERARLLTDYDAAFAIAQELNEAVKLSIYVGRQERVFGVPAYYAVCDLLYRRGLAGASVFLGVDGTAHGLRHRARFFGRNVNVPMMILAVGSGEQIARVVPELGGLLRRPLLTVERVRVCKRDGEQIARPHLLPAQDEQGLPLWQKLLVYTSETTHHDGLPIHRALVRRLLQSDTASGATVLRGIWGFHGGHEPHGDKLFQLTRQVPVTTIVVDTPERIAASFDIVDQVTDRHGLVTSELVPALVSVDNGERVGGTRLARYNY
jgi:PII-like signaling protein